MGMNSFIENKKFLIKNFIKKAKRKYLRLAYSFDDSDLTDLLSRLHINAGTQLLVHSSYDAFIGYTGKYSDIITNLCKAVGNKGTLMMPTLPFDSLATDFIALHQEFDIRKLPSKMGLLTELFRRMPNVILSPHPTHRVAALGSKADELTKEHMKSMTPCGKHSPYTKLLDCNGKILLLGVNINSMTFYHALEEILEEKLPFCPFTKKVYTLKCIDKKGNIFDVTTKLFDPAISKLRNLSILENELKRTGNWNEATIGRLTAISLDARNVYKAVDNLLEKGMYCYNFQTFIR
jgi:aminoglycoside 3-N-acetyltransferase